MFAKVMRKSLILRIVMTAVMAFGAVAAHGADDSRMIVLLGDSNTWYGGDGCDNPRGWNYRFAREMAGDSVVSYARSGAAWSHTPNTVTDTEEYTGVISDNNVIYNQIARLKEKVDSGLQTPPDMVMIAAGTNDAWFPQYRQEEFSRTAAQVLGEDPSTLLALAPGKVTSLAGAVRYDLLILKTLFPEAKIVVMTPLEAVKISPEMHQGVTEIIETVATESGAYVIRQDLLCPIDREQEAVKPDMTVDGVHTSVKGADRNGRVIARCVKSIFE